MSSTLRQFVGWIRAFTLLFANTSGTDRWFPFLLFRLLKGNENVEK